MKIRVNIGQLMREYLDANPHVTQNKLSAMAGVNPGTVVNYMKDDMKQPNLDTLAKLCDVIGVTDMRQLFLVEEE